MKLKTMEELVCYLEDHMGIKRDQLIVTFDPGVREGNLSHVVITFDCIEDYNLFRIMYYYLPSPHMNIDRYFVENYEVREDGTHDMVGYEGLTKEQLDGIEF